MSDIELEGQTYRIGRMTAKRQMHVMRRVAPIVPHIMPAATMAQDRKMADLTMADVAMIATPITEQFSRLSDADVDYVMESCLSVVQRRQGDRMMPVWNQAAQGPQFADMELPLLLKLVVRVMGENFSGFLGAFRPASSGPGTLPASNG